MAVNWIKIALGTLADVVVQAANAAKSAASNVLLVQPIDEDGEVIAGGAGGVGGGAGIYSVQQKDFTATYLAATQLTIAGLPSGTTVGAFSEVHSWDSTGVKTIYRPDKNAFAWNDSTGVLTVTGATFAATDDDYDVFMWDTPKGYSPSTDSNVVHVINPDWSQEDRVTLADITNGADDTYYYYIQMSTFRKLGLQLDLAGGSGTVTVTVEATLEDGADITALTYIDVTNDVFGAASYTADAILGDNAEKLAIATYVRIKVVASTGGADDADWTIEAKKVY